LAFGFAFFILPFSGGVEVAIRLPGPEPFFGFYDFIETIGDEFYGL